MTWLDRLNLTIGKQAATRARLQRRVCYSCGHVWRSGNVTPPYCHQCGQQNAYAVEPIALNSTPSDEIGELEPGIKIRDWLLPFPNGIPVGRSLVFRGRPGGGKSRCTFRLAAELGTTLVFCLEMGKVLSKETAANAGSRLGRMHWSDDVDRGLEDLEYLRPRAAVIDSIQKLGKSRARVTETLKSWAQEFNTNVLFVSQQGQHGASRYGEDDDFDCDVVIDVASNRTEKGRRKAIHGFDEKPTLCRDGHAHVYIAKSRVCPLIAFDVPIVAGV